MRPKTPAEVSRDILKTLSYFDQFLRDFHMRAAKIADEERVAGFQRGEAPDGSKWRPLSPKTLENKRKTHWSKDSSGRAKKMPPSKTPEKPLLDQHIMRQAAMGSNKNYGWLKIKWKGREDIAQYHETGGGRLPKRSHWGIYKKARERILDLWAQRWKIGLRILSK